MCTLFVFEDLPIQSAGETSHYPEGRAPLDSLQSAAHCYATALKCAPRDLQAHVGLGLVMEEFFYAEDQFGLQREVRGSSHSICNFVFGDVYNSCGSKPSSQAAPSIGPKLCQVMVSCHMT